jgi:hypothetical protein
MRIVSWTSGECLGSEHSEIARTLTEVDDHGKILREIGLDGDGRLLYIAPALRGKYRYGTFDLQRIDVASLPSEDAIPRDDFEALWSTGSKLFGARQGWTVS